jgi:hypothetical protein
MPMKSRDILGYVKPMVYFKNNIGRKACNWRFDNLFHNAWCVIKFVHHLMYPPHIKYLYQSWERTELKFCWVIDLNYLSYNQYVLVMIEHSPKWIELVVLYGKSSEMANYAFFDQILSIFYVLRKVLIN